MYQGKVLFSESTSTCQFVFKNKEEESTKLQLGRAFRLNVNPPAGLVSSYVDFTFDTTPYQLDYSLEYDEDYNPPIEEETEETEETEEPEESEEPEDVPTPAPPSNTHNSSWWIWLVIAVAGIVVVGGVITLIVCLVKRRKNTKKKESEDMLELKPTTL